MSIELWQVDPTRSEIKFTLRHLVFSSISGQARRWEATLRIDPDQPALSSVEVAIDARSIETGEFERDDHLRSAEFLNVADHPEIRFNSTAVTSGGEGRYLVKGDLAIGTVTREVTLDVLDLGRSTGGSGERHARFQGHTTFDRQTFGLHWNQDLDRGGVVLGDKVDVNVSLEAVRGRTTAHPSMDAAGAAR